MHFLIMVFYNAKRIISVSLVVACQKGGGGYRSINTRGRSWVLSVWADLEASMRGDFLRRFL